METRFTPDHNPHLSPAANSLQFVFWQQRMLVLTVPQTQVPQHAELANFDVSLSEAHYFGAWGDVPCFARRLGPDIETPPPSLEAVHPRKLYGRLPEELFWIAVRAHHLATWDETHRFCGQCGTALVMKTRERAKVCPSCDLTVFPRISPAVIMAVTRGDQILLANGLGWKSQYFGVLAGFLEPGESLEECVHREVMEEVGLKIKNVRYFGSQPWGFPDQLMVGFTAEYDSGEIVIDEHELTSANWYRADEIPNRWGKPSIGSALMDWFVNGQK